mmetsp:Transcript_5360/g.10643  ORF Transcript_5360/g.10643 Transcript_5360/m.10643 type:complete len:229 (+) Transcript_5360:2-688(+)|eukprot:scaffold36436_cov176-Amphora_coffeaeformis.AAC.15
MAMVSTTSLHLLLLAFFLLRVANSFSTRTTGTVTANDRETNLVKLCTTRSESTTQECHSISRRHFATGMLSLAGASVALLATPTSSNAKYGDSTNIKVPNYIDYLIEKNGQAVDEDKILYKGIDPTVILKRLQDANKRLDEIPGLAEQKKWSQISGLLTGPLGTLSQTLNQVAAPDSDRAVIAAAKKVKSDLISIGQAASQKNGSACSDAAARTKADLDAFVQLAFKT